MLRTCEIRIERMKFPLRTLLPSLPFFPKDYPADRYGTREAQYTQQKLDQKRRERTEWFKQLLERQFFEAGRAHEWR